MGNRKRRTLLSGGGSKENNGPNVLPVVELRKSSSDRVSTESSKTPTFKLSSHSKSAFEPFKHSKTTATESKILNRSISIIKQLENLFKKTTESSSRTNVLVDYQHCLKLASSLWEKTHNLEAQKIFEKQQDSTLVI